MQLVKCTRTTCTTNLHAHIHRRASIKKEQRMVNKGEGLAGERERGSWDGHDAVKTRIALAATTAAPS